MRKYKNNEKYLAFEQKNKKKVIIKTIKTKIYEKKYTEWTAYIWKQIFMLYNAFLKKNWCVLKNLKKENVSKINETSIATRFVSLKRVFCL